MRTERPYVSEAYQTAFSGHPRVVALAVRVRGTAPGGGDRDFGTVAALFDLKAIQRLTDDSARARGVRLTVTDQRGVVIAAPGASRTALTSLGSDPRVRAALQGRGGVAAQGPDGRNVLSAYAAVPTLGWAVIADVPHAAAFASLGRLHHTVLTVAGLLAVALMAGFGYPLAPRDVATTQSASSRRGSRRWPRASARCGPPSPTPRWA